MKNQKKITNDYLLLNFLRGDIKGWLSSDEGFTLYTYAKRAKGSILEIGAYEGLSTMYILAGNELGNKNKVFTIDTFNDTNTPSQGDNRKKNFWSNLETRNLTNKLNVITGLSFEIREMLRNTEDKNLDNLGMLFIDGSHDYESVKQDIYDWLPNLIPGGYICFHDYHENFKGVVKAVMEGERKGKFLKLEVIHTLYVGVII